MHATEAMGRIELSVLLRPILPDKNATSFFGGPTEGLPADRRWPGRMKTVEDRR
jgi:hypothetical protein